ncbi:MAG: methylmalonyl-CoA mutase, partial [Gemmatimonadetes bacterium HGW-Gemmatimonadetes-1]
TAVRVALRTQQILAYETGVAHVADPLGGSYYVEALTDQLEAEAEAIFARVKEMGGVVAAIEAGWFQREIAQSASRFQVEVETGDRTVVGVNAYVEDDSDPIEILKVTAEAERSQRERMARLRARRDQQLVDSRLAALADAARAGHNVIPAMLDAARAYCTLFEIRQVLEEIWGSYREPVFF